MEGNFRIVQYSENEYGIEKEVIYSRVLKKATWYRGEKSIIESMWKRCDIDGYVSSFVSLYQGEKFTPYSTSDLSVCCERLRRIKEFPKVIE